MKDDNIRDSFIRTRILAMHFRRFVWSPIENIQVLKFFHNANSKFKFNPLKIFCVYLPLVCYFSTLVNLKLIVMLDSSF